MKPATYGWAYLRGVAILAVALFLPLIVIGTIGTFFVGVKVGQNAWRGIWAGLAAAELMLLAAAAVQWKRAWALTLHHPRRHLLAGFSLMLAAVFLGAIVIVIVLNIRNNCEC